MRRATGALLALGISTAGLVGFEISAKVTANITAPPVSEACALAVKAHRRTTERRMTTSDHLNIILCKLGYVPPDRATSGAS